VAQFSTGILAHFSISIYTNDMNNLSGRCIFSCFSHKST